MITSVQAGWVEWLASEDKHGNDILRGLRLVHRGRQKNAGNHDCRYDPLVEFRSGRTIVEGPPLERLVGADGLMVLLSFLAEGELPHREILELVKRLQIPGYELVRNLVKMPIPFLAAIIVGSILLLRDRRSLAACFFLTLGVVQLAGLS